MRNRCEPPSRLLAKVVSTSAPLDAAVRAYRPPPMVLNSRNGRPPFSAKPTCWYGSPLNVATNSSELPGLYWAMVWAAAPSRVSRPLATEAAPPAPQVLLDQPVGKAEAE